MSKQFYFKQFSLAKVHSLVLFDPYIGLYQVLPLRDRVELQSDGNKRAFCTPQSSSITVTSPSDFLVIYSGHSLRESLLFRDAVGVFCSLSWLKPGSSGNKGVLRIPQTSSITEASPSDYLASKQDTRWGEYYPSAEMQSEYSAAPADWAIKIDDLPMLT